MSADEENAVSVAGGWWRRTASDDELTAEDLNDIRDETHWKK